MKTQKAFQTILLICFLSLIPCLLKGQSEPAVVAPEDHFGFTPGDDRMLFDYNELIEYMKILDEASPKLKMVDIGSSPLGKRMYIAFISSAENIVRLDELKSINRELALNPSINVNDKKEMIDKGKVFVLGTLSMHSGEVGPAQAAPLIAHELITSTDPKIGQWMDQVVYMMVPNHNPDGMDFIVNNYKKYKGTKYEGASLPRVYHKYVGHDNNRDFVILTQEDNRAVARIYNLDWFPQVMVEKHQMGSTGIRYFVPPVHDPIAENIDAELFNWTGIFGANMIRDMTEEGLAGVGQHTIFDMYWPGSTETCLWKNVIGMLTEAASAREATPIFIEPNELRVRGKGLSEYKKSINMPLPWDGGWWRLGDIVQYEITSTMSILKTAALHREEILKFRNNICQKEVNRGKTEPPYYYILPGSQSDPFELVNLVHLMKEHGVEVYQMNAPFTLSGRNFQQGDIVIPLAQPFRPFIKEVFEIQEFPVRHYTPGGEIIKPYDIASWSLPLHRGLESYEIIERNNDFEGLLEKIEGDYNLDKGDPGNFWAALFPASSNGSYKAAFIAAQRGIEVERLNQTLSLGGVEYHKGSFIIYGEGNGREEVTKLSGELKFTPGIIKEEWKLKTVPFSLPRIALVETYFHDMDAGWTRYIFDTYKIKFTVVHPDEFEKTDFSKNFDVVVFPNTNKSVLMTGKRQSGGSYYLGNYHPDYLKGMGKKGLENLMTFLDNGGIIVSWGSSTALFEGTLQISKGDQKEEFQLPFRSMINNLQSSGLYVAGSLLQVDLNTDHPLAYGMPDKAGVYFGRNTVFTTSVPRFDMDRRVIARFPEKNILLSGYSENEEILGNRSAMIWLKKGKGQLVLYGFNPQFRASTQGSYKLLFNALLLPKIKETKKK